MIPKTITLHWVCNSPSPYNDFLFRYVHENLGSKLLVHYLTTEKIEHAELLDTDTGYVWRRIKSRWFDLKLFVAAMRQDSVWVIGGWSCPIYVMLFLLASGRYLFWTDTPDESKQRSFFRGIIRKAITRLCFANAKAIMGTGVPALQRLEYLGASPVKLVNFPYWVDVPPEIFMNNPSSVKSILCVGRLEVVKSFEHVILLAAALRENGVSGFRIELIGDGSQLDELRSRVDRAGLGDCIVLPGWLDNQAVLSRMTACDIFLHPASWEPYGVVVLEAMAHGKTVIASDRTMAAIDRIVPEKNGFIYQYGNISSLANIVTRLIRDKSLLDETGRNAYLTASRWKVKSALSILEELVGQPGGAHS